MWRISIMAYVLHNYWNIMNHCDIKHPSTIFSTVAFVFYLPDWSTVSLSAILPSWPSPPWREMVQDRRPEKGGDTRIQLWTDTIPWLSFLTSRWLCWRMDAPESDHRRSGCGCQPSDAQLTFQSLPFTGLTDITGGSPSADVGQRQKHFFFCHKKDTS